MPYLDLRAKYFFPYFVFVQEKYGRQLFMVLILTPEAPEPRSICSIAITC